MQSVSISQNSLNYRYFFLNPGWKTNWTFILPGSMFLVLPALFGVDYVSEVYPYRWNAHAGEVRIYRYIIREDGGSIETDLNSNKKPINSTSPLTSRIISSLL
ncbi:MAG: hypothetical protein V1862_00855 [Methanobacteriota archaeon]